MLVDPPRAGLDTLTCQLISQFDKIVYISCNPTTLARDLKLLGATHDAVRLAAFDQFPYSHHLESGVILRRKTAEEIAAIAATAAAAAVVAASSSSSAAAGAGIADGSVNGANLKVEEMDEEEGGGSDDNNSVIGGSESEYIPGVLFKITKIPPAMNTYQLKDLLSKVARVRYVDRNDDGSTHLYSISYSPFTILSHYHTHPHP